MEWWTWSDLEDGGGGHGQILRMGVVGMVRSGGGGGHGEVIGGTVRSWGMVRS